MSKDSPGLELYDLFIINRRYSESLQICIGDRPQIRGPDYTQGFAERLGKIVFLVWPVQGDWLLLWESGGLRRFVQGSRHAECKWSRKNTQPW